METEELKALVSRVVHRKFESQTIELKKADGGCPKCRDTLSSFSNQDQGGIILFGIDEENNFNVNGVYDVADLEKKVQSQCAEMEPPVRAYFTEMEFKPGTFLVSAEIPACVYAKRPCYYLPAGRLGGSYVRVGEADEKMSEFEIYSYDAWHNRTREDLRIIKEASVKDFDPTLVSKLLANAREDRPNLQSIADEKSLELLGLVKEGKPLWLACLSFPIFRMPIFQDSRSMSFGFPGQKWGLWRIMEHGSRPTNHSKARPGK
jgi:ATP-dependent DNA helicase RecG